MKYKQVIIHKVDLQKLLKKAGLSMRQLAIKTGIAEQNMSTYNRDRKIMSEETWNKIKKVLNK